YGSATVRGRSSWSAPDTPMPPASCCDTTLSSMSTIPVGALAQPGHAGWSACSALDTAHPAQQREAPHLGELVDRDDPVLLVIDQRAVDAPLGHRAQTVADHGAPLEEPGDLVARTRRDPRVGTPVDG